MKLFVEGSGPIEIIIQLNVQLAVDVRMADATVGIGFSVYDLKGQKVTSNRVPDAVLDNAGGFMYANTVDFDGKIKPNPQAGVPYTFVMSTFEKGEQAKFNVVMWYKKSQGTIRLEEF